MRRVLVLTIFILNFNGLMSQSKEDLSLIMAGKFPDGNSYPVTSQHNEAPRRNSYFSAIMQFPIRFYKEFISSQMKPRCYFYPSCSQFTLEAIQEYGLAGVFLGIDRIMRCNVFSEEKYPFYKNTTRLYDPVSDYRLNKKTPKHSGDCNEVKNSGPPD